MMEKAAPLSLATHFNISVDNVKVTVTETRRLSEDVRRLAGTFAIDFVITVPPAKAAALTAKVEAAKAAPDTFKTEFATVAKAKLVAAGVPQATVDNLSVSAFTATAVYVPGTSGMSGTSKSFHMHLHSAIVMSALIMGLLSAH